MPYEIINEVFLLKNLNHPERIIERFNNPDLVIYKKSQSDIIEQCEKISDSNLDISEKERQITECIRNYHTTLYTKNEDI